ncbi:TetR/AcrR family transcriptional regulator [Xanthovirga aplysinae]|uniref:TetR/AcrR family transcriptional regulator n=1 Tax=Xanthovirga aplysinae TaxID=2529853 RepID=UPI0012BCC4E6|nr:TetR/AcrR family transcriptional regulator [Xanthovirga aplysinae]MTI29778.1 TetR/AcrR family transcriptional regulator [Xanthovirga aplysinae]
MPTITFEKISQEKKELLLRHALQEFALNDYQSASVSKIVKACGIAKGSLYQYFENKKDLYFYLKKVCEEKKSNYIFSVLNKPYDSFWDKYEAMYLEGIKFDLENPLHSGFLYQIYQEKNNEDLGDLLKAHKQKSLEIFEQLLVGEYQKGRLKKDLDLKIAAFMIVQLSIGIVDYLELVCGIDFRSNIKNNQPVFGLSDKELLHFVRHMSGFFRKSFGKS